MTEDSFGGLNHFVDGPVGLIVAAVRQVFPDLEVRRLAVTHAGDENNVWFITRPASSVELQLDSMPDGAPPFLLESDANRDRTSDAEEAAHLMISWLRQ